MDEDQVGSGEDPTERRPKDPGLVRLGDRIKWERCRKPQWRDPAAFAAACGIGKRTLATVENAERANVTTETYAPIEAALGWEVGDVFRVREGREPNRRWDQAMVRLMEIWPFLSDDQRNVLVTVAEGLRDSASR